MTGGLKPLDDRRFLSGEGFGGYVGQSTEANTGMTNMLRKSEARNQRVDIKLSKKKLENKNLYMISSTIKMVK